jgi:hypothetical protein
VIFAFGGCALMERLSTSCSEPAMRGSFRTGLPLRVLGMDGGDSACRGHAAAGHQHVEGIRRTGVADRHPHRAGLDAYAIVFFGTIFKRRTPHIYVANWFTAASILTISPAAHRQ